jgi:NADPH2:quinone reductase
VLRGGKLLAAAASPAERRHARELGADATVDVESPDWPAAVRDATGGDGVDVVLDAVGGDVGERSLECLAPFGRLVVHGVASKRPATFAGAQLMRGNQSVIGYRLAHRPGAGRGAAPVVSRLLELLEAGELRGVVRHAFALEEAAEAHRAVAARETVGKVVLTVE